MNDATVSTHHGTVLECETAGSRSVRLRVAHGLLAAPALLLLYAVSTPGSIVLALMAALGALLLAGIAWCVWLARLVRSRRWSWWVLVAPVGGCLAALVATDVPLKARWAVSHEAFAAQVKTLPAAPADPQDRISMNVPGHLGLYHVTEAYRVQGGVLFYEANGSGLNYAGFAYLPDGPSEKIENGLFESPQYRHLAGPWYAWTASW